MPYNSQGGGHRSQPYGNNNSRGGGRGGRGGRGGGGGGLNRNFNDITHTYEERPSWVGLPQFEKCFYREHEETSQLTEVVVEAFRSSHQMTLSGVNIPRPILKVCENIFLIFL